MTVPMMRRGGVPMADAAASANPLSLPVAVVATAVYAVSSGTVLPRICRRAESALSTFWPSVHYSPVPYRRSR